MTPTGLMHDLLAWLDDGHTWNDLTPGHRQIIATDLRSLADTIEHSPVDDPPQAQIPDSAAPDTHEQVSDPSSAENILSTLDAYIAELATSRDKFETAAAADDRDVENEAADELAADVFNFVRWASGSEPPASLYATLAADLVENNIPHAWGGGTFDGPSPAIDTGTNPPAAAGFDAGSLSQYLHFHADGIELPRTTFTQYAHRGPDVELHDAEPAGDLIWPRHDDHRSTVATYLGDGRAADAGGVGGHVRIVSLNELEPLVITRPEPTAD